MARPSRSLESLRADHEAAIRRLATLRDESVARRIEEAKLEVSVELHAAYGAIIEELQQGAGYGRNGLRREVLRLLEDRGKVGAALKEIRAAHGSSVDALMPKLSNAELVALLPTRNFTITTMGRRELKKLEEHIHR